jgi:hypothetical protein
LNRVRRRSTCRSRIAIGTSAISAGHRIRWVSSACTDATTRKADPMATNPTTWADRANARTTICGLR